VVGIAEVPADSQDKPETLTEHLNIRRSPSRLPVIPRLARRGCHLGRIRDGRGQRRVASARRRPENEWHSRGRRCGRRCETLPRSAVARRLRPLAWLPWPGAQAACAHDQVEGSAPIERGRDFPVDANELRRVPVEGCFALPWLVRSSSSR
jgi:hypothetical protein